MANRRARETIQTLEGVADAAMCLAQALFLVTYGDECMIEYDKDADAFDVFLYGLTWEDGVADKQIKLKGKSVEEACRALFGYLISYKPDYGKDGKPRRLQSMEDYGDD